jgi:RNA polymerase sigma-70 factor (ECF subfamily)
MEEQTSNLVDELLVMDAQDGDRKAMQKLVERWQRRLWHHAYRVTSDAEAAWDITQQSWLGIIKGLRKLHDPANFKAWAYKITTNKSIDWMKRSEAANEISIEEIQDQEHIEKKDTGIKELLEKLDMRRRAVISLYYFEQLSIPEISAALNIPRGTVKSRLDRARKELKKLWQQHLE